MAQILVIPLMTRLYAAFNRPALSRKSLHRALPITVPPFIKIMPIDKNLVSPVGHHIWKT